MAGLFEGLQQGLGLASGIGDIAEVGRGRIAEGQLRDALQNDETSTESLLGFLGQVNPQAAATFQLKQEVTQKKRVSDQKFQFVQGTVGKLLASGKIAKAKEVADIILSDPENEDLKPYLQGIQGSKIQVDDPVVKSVETFTTPEGAPTFFGRDDVGNVISVNGETVTPEEGREALSGVFATKIPPGLVEERTRTKIETEQDVIKKFPPLQSLKEKKAPSDFFTAVRASQDLDSLLVNVEENAKIIPKNKLGSIATAIRANNLAALRDPELQALATSMELLIQTVTRKFQGGRPTDKDREVIARAIGNIAGGKATFQSGFDEVKSLADLQKKTLFDEAKTGFGTDISELPGFEQFSGKKKEKEIDLTNIKEVSTEDLLKSLGL